MKIKERLARIQAKFSAGYSMAIGNKAMKIISGTRTISNLVK
jgi:hypothetical protein